MKRMLTAWVLFLLPTLWIGGCSHHKIIPDSRLAEIFRDAFLANAYVSTHSLRLDSLNIYEPIFADYGYTTADVQYTIGNFSKRKSARLGDVVELAIDLLEREGAYYDREVGILDTIDNVARRTFTRTVYADSLIEVHRLKDTGRLRIVVKDLHPGEYEVRCDYLVDSLDENCGQRISAWIERADSSRAGSVTASMRRERDDTFSRKLTADTASRRMVIDLGMPEGRRLKRPHMTFRNLKVIHTLPTADAVDSLYIKELNIRIFADEFIRLCTPDSLSLAAGAGGAR